MKRQIAATTIALLLGITTAGVLSTPYTTDESGQLIDGSCTEPARFEEYWTFVRPVGPGAWRLSAIQQAG